MILTKQNWFYLIIVAVLLTALTALKFCHPEKIKVQPSIVSKHTVQSDTVVKVRTDTVRIPVVRYRIMPATTLDTGYCPNFAVNQYSLYDTIYIAVNCKEHRLDSFFVSQKPIIIYSIDTLTRYVSTDTIIQTIYADKDELLQVHGGGEYDPLGRSWNAYAKAGMYFERFNIYAKPSFSNTGLSAFIGAEVRLF